MPIYDYRCEECNGHYEVFHKVREVAEDIVCPACASRKYRKMMSVPAAPSVGASSYASSDASGACDNAGGCGCSGGSCGMN